METKRMILNETSYFGFGCRNVIIEEIKKRKFSKALIVSDSNLVNAGITKKVTDILDSNLLAYEIFDEIKQNPTVSNVKLGVLKCRESSADYIIAVGGGSSIDTAKAIGIIMTNPKYSDVISLDGAISTENKCLPIIALPTTAGTAAEVTINYVITDEKNQKKMVCVDTNSLPIVAIVDTELMSFMPTNIMAATGMDALTHAVEGYITKGSWSMSDMFHMEAIKIIFKNLRGAVNDKNIESIENISRAQYIAGMGFSNVGLGIVHSMAHSLGAFYDTPHGVANALLLPYVMEYNGGLVSDKFSEILHNLGYDVSKSSKEEIIDAFVYMIKKLSSDIKIPSSLREIGAKEEDIESLAIKAFNDVCTGGNPRDTSVEDIIEIYKKAF